MAKELPYFKFEPNQWENGNIQICSREDKGLFIDLCSMYWSRLGELPFKLAVNKLCGGNASAFDSLISENIFIVEEGMICIDYLNEQLEEFENTRKVNSKNAKEGWEKRRKQRASSERNATASNSQCENDAIREEKRREEKKKEDNKNASAVPALSKFDFKKALLSFGFNSDLVNEWMQVRKVKRAVNSETSFNMFINEILKAPSIDKNEILKICVGNSWKGFKAEWLQNINQNNYGNNTNKQQPTREERNAEYLAKTISALRGEANGNGSKPNNENGSDDFATFEIMQ